jgi:hypothetical protein
VRGRSHSPPAEELAGSEEEPSFWSVTGDRHARRILQDGASTVRIQGDEITVRARIRELDIYSAMPTAAS